MAALLGDEALTYTGIGIKGECTRINNVSGVPVANAIDLGTQVQTRKVLTGQTPGLVDLFSNLLGRRLLKADIFRSGTARGSVLTRNREMTLCNSSFDARRLEVSGLSGGN